MNKLNLIKGAIYGHIVADALGVPVEFIERGNPPFPITDMIGHGTHNQPLGTWSDDSSMVLATMEALLDGYSVETIANSFVEWAVNNKWTPHGVVFDIGMRTAESVRFLSAGIPPTVSGGFDEYSNGNGSLMRILPLVFETIADLENLKYTKICVVSGITHAHIRSKLACYYYVRFAQYILKGYDKFQAYRLANSSFIASCELHKINLTEIQKFSRILDGNIHTINYSSIHGTGYVIHTLEASLWCILNTTTYDMAVLSAVNLGDDTDTTAAVTGGIAGLIYGYDSIPTRWINCLARLEKIDHLVNAFLEKYK